MCNVHTVAIRKTAIERHNVPGERKLVRAFEVAGVFAAVDEELCSRRFAIQPPGALQGIECVRVGGWILCGGKNTCEYKAERTGKSNVSAPDALYGLTLGRLWTHSKFFPSKYLTGIPSTVPSTNILKFTAIRGSACPGRVL